MGTPEPLSTGYVEPAVTYHSVFSPQEVEAIRQIMQENSSFSPGTLASYGVAALGALGLGVRAYENKDALADMVAGFLKNYGIPSVQQQAPLSSPIPEKSNEASNEPGLSTPLQQEGS